MKFRLTGILTRSTTGRSELGLGADDVSPEYRTQSKRIDVSEVPFKYMNIDWYFEAADGGTTMRGSRNSR